MGRGSVPKERRENLKFILIMAVGLGIAIWFGNDFFIAIGKTTNSVSKGHISDGSISNSKRLPTSGENYETYSRLGSTIGRTCVHHAVRNTIVSAYDLLHETMPAITFVYGETGWCWGGGDFYPHHTHQNGLSVDFMVPVRRSGESVAVPTSIIDGFGYLLEFNSEGKLEDYSVDFEAIAAHLLALENEGKKHGVKIKRIILAPGLQKKLFKSGKAGRMVKRRFKWNKKQAWVRHDDHYHVDFVVNDKANEKPKRSSKRIGD